VIERGAKFIEPREGFSANRNNRINRNKQDGLSLAQYRSEGCASF